ncbi:MAG: DUF721 domain-containing protein [Deltaproteobacteria bacterium]|nr:DUF721 domain-containing protein [Deltaproteobacteria bacterium]
MRITDALSIFLDKRGGKEHARLTMLWEHWNMVMGEDLASLAAPLGHKKDVLLLAAEDSMAAQEIAMQSGEVLERVNAFMSGRYFSRIQVELVMGRNDLSRASPALRPQPPEYRAPKPERLGALKGALDPESPVARCYEAYLRYFSRTY